MKYPIVIVKKNIYTYPKKAPFLSDKQYPELDEMFVSEKEPNHVFSMVREGLYLMGFDGDNYGTSNWNPLGHLIKPGNQVLIKPNMVLHQNHNLNAGNECLYTHPSLVSATLIYAIIALKGRGNIIVGDAPMQECDFNRLIHESGYYEMINYYNSLLPDISIELKDFRELHSEIKFGVHKQYINDDSSGVVIDLGSESEFAGLSQKEYDNLRITNYDPNELKKHHNEKRNEYLINRSVINSDVIINMPKPKTHRKAGVTIALKNIVGINARKEYLPHHTNGAKPEGGDEYLDQSIKKRILDKLYDAKNISVSRDNYLKAFFYKVIIKFVRASIKYSKSDNYYEGSWYGNNTINKTIVDLNKILFFSDKTGKMTEEKQRKYLVVGDMIVSGEKEGPVAPSPKEVGIVALGENPVCYDEVIASLMGAEIEFIPSLTQVRQSKSKYKFVRDDDTPLIISNDEALNGKNVSELSENDLLYYTPSSGWMKVFKTKK